MGRRDDALDEFLAAIEGAGHTTLEDLVPGTLLGFSVEIRVGPYPPHATWSRRRAVYAVLTPIDGARVDMLRRMGRERLLGWQEIHPDGVQRLEDDREFAEVAAMRAFSAAQGLLKGTVVAQGRG